MRLNDTTPYFAHSSFPYKTTETRHLLVLYVFVRRMMGMAVVESFGGGFSFFLEIAGTWLELAFLLHGAKARDFFHV